MSKVISERCFETKVSARYFKYEKEKNELKEHLDYVEFKNNEEMRESVTPVLNERIYANYVGLVKRKLRWFEYELGYRRIKVEKDLKEIKKYLIHENRTVIICLYKEDKLIKKYAFKMEKPRKEFNEKEIEKLKVLDYLKMKLLNGECDLVKIEICKPLNN